MSATLRCPKCGTPMNRHAEKSLNSFGHEASSNIDPDFGGPISSIHFCPGCGNVEMVVEPIDS